jgi:gliding motility-associated-like protein
MVIYLPENTGNSEQSGTLKAEIISCDQNDANPDTHYGNWRDDRNWVGDPQEADEDALNLTVYQNLRLTGKLKDTICSGETFTYIPESNIASVQFSWVRYSVPGIDEPYNSGTGGINEVLTNTYDIPVTVTYTFTLDTDFCPSYVTMDVEVVVFPKGRLTLSHSPDDGNRIVLGTPITLTAILEGASANEYIFKYSNEIKKQSNNWIEIYSFNDQVVNEVEVQVENEYGCLLTAKDSFMIDYSLPNMITPNEDKNNRLLKGYDVLVFNRWGSQLYRGNTGWDGRYKGTLVAAGTYFYVVYVTQSDGTRREFKRSVYVKY